MSQTVQKRTIAPWKKELAAEIARELDKSQVIAVAGLEKVRSIQVQELRKKLRGRIVVKVLKNTLMRKAAEQAEKKRRGITEFSRRVSGPNLYMFTEMDPFQLAVLLQTSKVRVSAKVGDVATSDIVIPAGNTALAPGPVISEFGEAKVQTKIEGGSIWVVRDTLVAEKGQAISAKTASLLSRLGIKPIEAGLTLKAAYDRGIIIGPESLAIDLEVIRTDLLTGVRHATCLAVEMNYLTAETAPLILGKAYRQAIALAVQIKYETPETASLLPKPEANTAPAAGPSRP